MTTFDTGKIYQGDSGTELLVRVLDDDDQFTRDDDTDDARAVDLSGSTVLLLRAEKPDRTVVEWAAERGSVRFPQRTGARGWMHYLTQATDLDQVGHWRLQPKITVPGWSGRAEIHDLLVHPVL